MKFCASSVLSCTSLAILLFHDGLLSSDAFMTTNNTPSGSYVSSRTAFTNPDLRLLFPDGNSALHMSTRASSTTTKTNSKPKKTVADRTQAETNALIRDIIQAAIEAGPRAGPARTIQAYNALIRTVQDFIPTTNTRTSNAFTNPFFPTLLQQQQQQQKEDSTPETFSPPLALRKIFERMGATYIKLGQFIASSPTIFPKEYVVEFQKCLDSTEPLPWNVIEKVIQQELRSSGYGSINSVFESIEKEPLASASIAQVHGAVLKGSGRRVVIKVQKPNIDESLKADLSFIYVASRVLEFIQPDFERTSLSAIAGDIRSSMLEELDFEKEATNLEEFCEFLVRNGLEDVATAPEVYREYTSKKIMVMERLDGVSMLDADKISEITKSNPEATIITALNVWTTSVMTMPWFHADVHAGNLLVLKDGRVGFIDFGIVGRVSDTTFKAVNELSAALTLGDYEGMARALCNMGATDEEVNIKQFADDIERVMMNLSSVQTDVTVTAFNDGTVQGSLDFDESEVTNVLLDIVDVTENNGLKLPREFGLLVKQSLYFDRYLKILAPNLDVMSDARVGLGGNMDDLNGSKLNGLKPEEVLIDV